MACTTISTLSVILCLVLAGDATTIYQPTDNSCTMSVDPITSMLSLNLDISKIVKEGPPGPPGVAPPEVKKLEDKIAALEKDVKELREKVGIVDEKENKTEEGTFIKGGRKYWISSGTYTWEDAQKYCEKKEGKLAIKGVRQVRGQKEIIEALFPVGGIAWIGFDDKNKEGTWVWNDGTEATAENTDWYPGEPNNVGDQDCGSLRYGLDGIDDDRCGVYHQALCSE